jgi:hypothetical protein
MLPASTSVQLVSTNTLCLSAALAPLSALHARGAPRTALPACTVRSRSTVPAPLPAVRMSSVSRAFAWLVLTVATGASITLKTVSIVQVGTSKQGRSARKGASPISSSITTSKSASAVDRGAPPAPPTTTAPHARTQLSLPEEEFAPIVPTLAPPAKDQEPALPVSPASTSSKAPARPPALLAHPQSIASASAPQALSPTGSASPPAVQASLQSVVAASLATLTALSVQAA